MDDRTGGARRPAETPTKPEKTEAERRRQFAEALARAEFGRFYWSDRQERVLRAAGSRPRPKPAK